MPKLNSPALVPVSLRVNGRVFDLILDLRATMLDLESAVEATARDQPEVRG